MARWTLNTLKNHDLPGKETWREHVLPQVTENEQVKMPAYQGSSKSSVAWHHCFEKTWRILYHTRIPEKGKSESWEKPRRQERSHQSGIWGIRTFKHCASYGLHVLPRNWWTDYEEKEPRRPLDNSFKLSSRGKACHFPWKLWQPQLLIFLFLNLLLQKNPSSFFMPHDMTWTIFTFVMNTEWFVAVLPHNHICGQI